MSTTKETSSYLKTRVYRYTKAYVCVAGFILAWLNLRGLHFSWALTAVSIPEWISSGSTLLATAAAALVDALPGDYWKSVLVFWRWRDPLPGTRAFQRANLERDQRISVPGLLAQVGGKFPRSPQDQNSTWYRLYKTVQSEPEVAGTHFEYLLFRDLTWFTTVIGTVALLSITVNPGRWQELLAFAAIATSLYVLLSRAATSRGERFVRTVLAVVASRPVPSSDTVSANS